MRSLAFAGILVLAATVLACTDLTSPDLSDGIHASLQSVPPDPTPPHCVVVRPGDGAVLNQDCFTDGNLPPEILIFCRDSDDGARITVKHGEQPFIGECNSGG